MKTEQTKDGKSRLQDGEGRTETMARGLGWFSIGLGTAELLAPSGLARLIGVADTTTNRTALRMFGLREIATGIGMLARPETPSFAWLRVVGDVLDLASLGNAMMGERSQRGKLAAAAAAVAGVTALDVMTAQQLARRNGTGTPASREEVTRAVTIARPAEEIYKLWRNFENLPRFMSHLAEVRTTGERTSHWVVKTLGGMKVEWDAEIVDDQPGKRISWRSLDGADIQSQGTVEFRTAPRRRGTEVCVRMSYKPPGGKLGAALASLVGEEPGQIADHALRQLKQLMEVGEIVLSDASVHHGPHAARPMAKDEPEGSMGRARRVIARVVESTPSEAERRQGVPR